VASLYPWIEVALEHHRHICIGDTYHHAGTQLEYLHHCTTSPRQHS
jgi:hypothetical protein